ncbi:type 1 periplasmic-binding domain-containing protein [Limnochorda pilosa]|uniref:Uncharacterized protein n=1 Tax=Limnochorda pilosa TaxID=1555112 RepID=A0A0K2SMT9_LIMPI|nr:hypothetical protein [Limnochorda pilosa]BAS28134.1 hypothetical protein LIP_2293 [Limnochorda pilosa]
MAGRRLTGYQPLTIRRIADRIRTGEEPWISIREFLDDFYASDDERRASLIAARPEYVGDQRFDAYLAALAEHLAMHYNLPVPPWVHESQRFLERFWFPTSIRSLHATCLVESPASFRRRGIFVDHTELERC